MINLPLRVLLTLLLGFALLPCPQVQSTPQTTVKVGAFNFAPVIFKAEDGAVQGVFVDLLDEIGRQEDIRFEYVFGSWQQGLDQLKSGEIDLMTSVAHTEERAKFMDYGQQSLMTVWSELYTHKNSKLQSLLDVAGKKIAVMKGDYNGSSFIDLVHRFGIKCEFVEAPDFKSVLQEVEAGNADAGVLSILAGVSEAGNYQVKRTGILFNPFDIYFTAPKGQNAELLALLDDYLQRWRNDEQSIYFTSHSKWFHEKLQVRKITVVPEWLWRLLVGILLFFLVALVFIVILRRRIKTATADLRASEAHFRKAIEEAPIPVMMHAEDGEVLALSSTWSKLSGYAAKDIPTTDDWTRKAYGGEHRQIMEAINQLYWLNAPKQEGDYVIRCADGSPRVWAFSSTAIGRLPDSRRIAISMASDVTEQKHSEQERARFTEQLEAKNAELERISYTISHDLKTPLVTLKSFIEYLDRDLVRADTQQISRDIHFIKTAADKMSQLLNELLEFTRLGHIVETPVEMSFSAMITEVLSHLAGEFENRQVAVLPTSEDLLLYASPLRMKELWQNLLENAVKYMGEQPAPQISLGFNRLGNDVVFFVMDNGIGIESQYCDRIFKLFEKLDSSVEGTGIGLAIVSRIVTLYQGKIWVESAGPGTGSCFKFTLPQALAAAPKEENEEQKTGRSSAGGR